MAESEFQANHRKPYGRQPLRRFGERRKGGLEPHAYDAEERMHSGLGSYLWALGELGPKIRLATLYICEKIEIWVM